MNPVVTPVENDYVVVQLDEQDRKLLRKIHLRAGGQEGEEVAFHKMCIMQAVTALTTPSLDLEELAREYRAAAKADDYFTMAELHSKLELSDTPVCVSGEIASAMMTVNDWDLTPRERGRLKTVVDEILNTCPVKRTEKKVRGGGTVVTEAKAHNRKYMEVERERARILRPIFPPHSHRQPSAPERPSVGEALKLIRQAADLFRVEVPSGLQSSD